MESIKTFHGNDRIAKCGEIWLTKTKVLLFLEM